MGMKVVNPATGESTRSYEEISTAEARDVIQSAQRAFLAWRTEPFAVRGRLMRAAAKALRDNQDEYARLMTEEMGKPLAQAMGEVEKCAWTCEFFAEHGERMLAPENIATEFSKSYVAFQPIGLVLGVMPWNFPFWQAFRAAVPSMMAGNGFILKHASNVPGCALAIEQVFIEAGFPDDLFRTLLVGSGAVGELIAHPLIRAVTVTGSSEAGAAVAAKAGAMLKKTVLELGGSDPYVVLDDADLPSAVETCVTARLINSGQSCIAAKRFIVSSAIRKDFETRFVEAMNARKMGDPLEQGVTIGPLARHDLRDSLHSQVERSVAAGARLLTGGKVPPGKGAYYPATVLGEVRKGMPAFDEETFGPVAAIIEARDDAEAIELANASSFGLGAAVFTGDVRRGERVAQALEAGCCFVNEYVRSDPASALRWRQAKWLWPRAFRIRHQGIRQYKNPLREVELL